MMLFVIGWGFAPLCTFSLVEDGRRLGVPCACSAFGSSYIIAAQAAFELMQHDVRLLMEELTRQISNLSELELVVRWAHVGHIIMTPEFGMTYLCHLVSTALGPHHQWIWALPWWPVMSQPWRGWAKGADLILAKRIRRKFATWLVMIWIHLLQRLLMFGSSLMECI